MSSDGRRPNLLVWALPFGLIGLAIWVAVVGYGVASGELGAHPLPSLSLSLTFLSLLAMIWLGWGAYRQRP